MHETSAHGDLIIAMGERPRPHPATELFARLDHVHRRAAFGQPNGGRDASNATAGDNNWPGHLGQPGGAGPCRVTNSARVPAEPGSPRGQPAKGNDHKPAHGSPDRLQPTTGPGNRVLLNDQHPALGEQVKQIGQHCIPIGNIAEQVSRKSSVDVTAKSP
jgi:hypothetical protein